MRHTSRTKTRMTLLICGVAPLAIGLGLSGCGGEPVDGDVSASASALYDVLPTGVTCGVTYKNGSYVISSYCNSSSIAHPSGLPNGYITYSDGDAGLSNGNGFYHQSYNQFYSGYYDHANVNLPQGTVCGFKHTGHGDSSTCHGADPEKHEVPTGWTLRIGGDAGAPSGSNFTWYEYDDIYGNCTAGNCSLPAGTACGMTDSDRGPNGWCMGRPTGAHRWPEHSGDDNCPAGFTWSGKIAGGSGFWDAGRSSGHGIGWCVKT